MFNNKFALTTIFLAIGLGNTLQAHAGSAYLYCVSKTNTSSAPYAKWDFIDIKTKQKRNLNEKFRQWGGIKEGINNSVWIEGELGYKNNKPNLVMLSGGDSAWFCNALKEVCTDQYGPDYSYIGSGGGPTVYGWNGVAVRTNGEYLTSAQPCPNWWTE